MIEIGMEERTRGLNIGPDLLKGWDDEVTMMSCVEGHMGQLWVDDRDHIQRVLGVVGDFAFLLGEESKDIVKDKGERKEFIDFLKRHGKYKIIIAQMDKWKHVLKQLAEEEQTSFESFSRFAMKGSVHTFDIEALKENINRIPERYSLHRIDEKLYQMALAKEWSKDLCSNFTSYQQFADHGIGYVICYEEEIVAGASTYAYCTASIEIEIVTHENFRRRGFAKICGSGLILEALERGLYPRWDAAHMGSVALAEQLGYTFDHEYKAFCI